MAADDQEYYGYYYDTEEDRGLLDPAWERQQKKVVSSACSDIVNDNCMIYFLFPFTLSTAFLTCSQKLNILTTLCFAYLSHRLLQLGVILI